MEQASPGFATRWLRRLRVAVAVVLLIALTVFWWASFHRPPDDVEVRRQEVELQLRFLDGSLESGGQASMQRLFPEGAAFSATLFGLASAELARASDPGSERRALCVERVARAVDLIDRPVAVEPFQRTQVRRGVFWLGQRNLLLAEWYALTDPDRRDAGLVAEFDRNSAELGAAYANHASPNLDAYPGLCWPADNVTALVSILLHRRLRPEQPDTGAEAAYARWKAWAVDRPDPMTGLIPGRVESGTGRMLEPGRGCGSTWSIALLARVDPDFAWTQYVALRDSLGIERLGFRMFREWPADDDRPSDVDSGPIVWGAGMTATAVGLAAANAVGDTTTAADTEALTAMFGLRMPDGRGGEGYLLGFLPVADGFLAWARSLALADGSPGYPVRFASRWPFHLLVLLVAGVVCWGGVGGRPGGVVRARRIEVNAAGAGVRYSAERHDRR